MSEPVEMNEPHSAAASSSPPQQPSTSSTSSSVVASATSSFVGKQLSSILELIQGNVYICQNNSGADNSHCAVYVGLENQVPVFIHVHGVGATGLTARVQRTAYDPSRYVFFDHPWNARSFCPVGEKPKPGENQRFSNEVVVARAERAFADFKNKKYVFVYDLKYSNTEHFAMMCLANEYFSPKYDAKYYQEMNIFQKAESSLRYIPTNGYSGVQWIKSFFTETALPMNQKYSENLPVTAVQDAPVS